jgi:hypothetical protein
MIRPPSLDSPSFAPFAVKLHASPSSAGFAVNRTPRRQSRDARSIALFTINRMEIAANPMTRGQLHDSASNAWKSLPVARFPSNPGFAVSPSNARLAWKSAPFGRFAVDHMIGRQPHGNRRQSHD